MAKYKLTDNIKKTIIGELRQIEALEDIKSIGVNSGDLGGWIESEGNLDQSGNAWVSGDAQVYGDAQVSGDAQVYGDAWVYGNAWVSGNAWVYGDAWVYGNAWVSGNARVYGDAQVSGDAQVYGNARVYGDAWNTTPPYFAKQPYPVFMPTKSILQVGCQKRSWDYWRKNHQRIAEMFDMQSDLMIEYIRIFNFFVKEYGDGITIEEGSISDGTPQDQEREQA